MGLQVYSDFLALVRLGIGHAASVPLTAVDWIAIKALADEQGLSAVLLDGIEKLNTLHPDFTNPIPQAMRMDWVDEVLQDYDYRYELYLHTIAEMERWYQKHGFKMMVLKGYACSLNWPKPEHRPCGDIDIWLFGQQKEADAALEASFRVHDPSFKIDNSHHHHSVFYWRDFMVENHYDFLNVHHHKSNVALEAILKDLGKDNSHSIELYGEKVYLPSPNLHALFLLRHSMSNFASTDMRLRQLLDWAFFVKEHTKEVDWQWLEDTLEQFGMKRLYDVFNAICVEDLGFDFGSRFMLHSSYPDTNDTNFTDLKNRVLNEMLSREFTEKEKGGLIRRAIFKYRRWKANEWKHKLCFKESMWSAFWSGVWGHLLKPSSI